MNSCTHRSECHLDHALKLKALENNLSEFRKQLAQSETENIRLRHILEVVRDSVFCDIDYCNCSKILSDLASHALRRNT
jgi:hypothetical protein